MLERERDDSVMALSFKHKVLKAFEEELAGRNSVKPTMPLTAGLADLGNLGTGAHVLFARESGLPRRLRQPEIVLCGGALIRADYTARRWFCKTKAESANNQRSDLQSCELWGAIEFVKVPVRTCPDIRRNIKGRPLWSRF